MKNLSELIWIEELLPPVYLRKPMFGGFAYYIESKLILVIFASTGDRVHKGQTYDFDLWHGCMFPVEHEHQTKIKARFSYLISHPVLPKWLYLPAQTENFDAYVEEILKEIRRKSKFFGTIPKPKKKIKSNFTLNEKIDTRKPRMFSDESLELRLSKATRISDLKNLGPATEKSFHKAGIKTVNQFLQLGWQKTLVKLVKSNSKNCHAIFAYALIGALTNKEWFLLTSSEKEEAKKFTASLRNKKRS